MLLSGFQKKIATSFNHYFNETWDFNVKQRNQDSLSSMLNSPREPQTCSLFPIKC